MTVVARVLVTAVLLGACTTGKLGSTNTLGGAAATSAAAVGAALAERAAGGCVAICTAGTACTKRCAWAACEKCVAGGPTSVETLVKGKTPVVPAFLPATAPPQNGSPTIVPTAEQAAPR